MLNHHLLWYSFLSFLPVILFFQHHVLHYHFFLPCKFFLDVHQQQQPSPAGHSGRNDTHFDPPRSLTAACRNTWWRCTVGRAARWAARHSPRAETPALPPPPPHLMMMMINPSGKSCLLLRFLYSEWSLVNHNFSFYSFVSMIAVNHKLI